MIKVYIAGPYTKGDVAVNVKRAMDCFEELANAGFCPCAPIANYHFQHMAHPRTYEEWMKLDLEWLKACDCVLRLDGESPGADREVAAAQAAGMGVFHSVADVIKCSPKPIRYCVRELPLSKE